MAYLKHQPTVSWRGKENRGMKKKHVRWILSLLLGSIGFGILFQSIGLKAILGIALLMWANNLNFKLEDDN